MTRSTKIRNTNKSGFDNPANVGDATSSDSLIRNADRRGFLKTLAVGAFALPIAGIAGSANAKSKKSKSKKSRSVFTTKPPCSDVEIFNIPSNGIFCPYYALSDVSGSGYYALSFNENAGTDNGKYTGKTEDTP